jgi:peptidyl-prolyl cis-trans isomerase SurA
MKIRRYILIFIIQLTFFNNIAKSVENKIIFKINNEIITTLDLLNEIKYLNTLNTDFKKFDQNKIYEISKNSLIREKIKEIELLKFYKSIKIDNEYIDRTINKIVVNANFKNINDFLEYLNKENIKLDTIKKKITIELMWNDLIVSKFLKNIKIDKEKIREDTIKNNKQKEYLLSEIIFSIKDKEKIDKKFISISQTIKEKNFNNAALIYSISETANMGGKLGWVKENSINKKIKKELLKISIGQHTQPIVVPGGFLILKIDNIRVINVDKNIDNEIELIVKQKISSQLNQQSNKYFKKIKKDYLIYEL